MLCGETHRPRNLLTDSGGFQMVSLLHLAQITEEGVRMEGLCGVQTGAWAPRVVAVGLEVSCRILWYPRSACLYCPPPSATTPQVNFQSPEDGTQMMLTPEMSMALQNQIGADIMMVRASERAWCTRTARHRWLPPSTMPCAA